MLVSKDLLDALGRLFFSLRSTNGRIYYFSPDTSGGDPWWEPIVDGPRPIYASEDFGFLWTLSDGGQVHRYATSREDDLSFDAVTRTVRTKPGNGAFVELSNPVVRIANSGDNRETFALTTTGEVFWLDVARHYRCRLRWIVSPNCAGSS